jgi:hypothetical protein
MAIRSSKQKEATKPQTTDAVRDSRPMTTSVLRLAEAIKKSKIQILKSDNRIRAALDVNAVDEANVF